MDVYFEFQQKQPANVFSHSHTTPNTTPVVEKKRIAENPFKLVFYTDTDESTEYPIYISTDRETWIKKRPQSIAAVFNVKVVNVYRSLMPVRNESELAKVLADANADEKTAELAKLAYTALRSLSSFAVFAKVVEIKYEVYKGDFAEYLGDASVRVVKLSAYSKFPAHQEKQAWGIAYNSVKRIAAKYQQLTDLIYPDVTYVRDVTDDSIIVTKKHTVPHAVVHVKMPIVTQEFEQLFNRALATTVSVSVVDDLEKQINELEKLIEQKRAELRTLEEQLQNMKTEFQLEKMKSFLISDERQ